VLNATTKKDKNLLHSLVASNYCSLGRVYGFWGCEGRFAELLRILEKKGESVWRRDADRLCCRICATNLATRSGVGRSVRGAVGRARCNDGSQGSSSVMTLGFLVFSLWPCVGQCTHGGRQGEAGVDINRA
jgi:hypothetical protein